MTYYFRQGNQLHVADDRSVDMVKFLPPATYTVGVNPMTKEIYLIEVDNFTLPTALYGTIESDTDRVLNTYVTRPTSTGVMLAGEKGSGKTLFAKTLSVKARERMGMPTVIINIPLSGDGFNKFIQDIDQPCVILFDEFEKVYNNKDSQQSILTLLDGTYPTQKLFVLTCNDKYAVDDNMRNRPGRLFYMLDFTGLEESFVREYCARNFKPEYQEYTDDVISLMPIIKAMNFDMLASMVEEINRYGDRPQQAVRMLNVKPDSWLSEKSELYNVTILVDGKPVNKNHVTHKQWHGNPMSNDDTIDMRYFLEDGTKDKDGDPHMTGRDVSFFPEEALVSADYRDGTYEFDAGGGVTVMFQRRGKKRRSFRGYDV